MVIYCVAYGCKTEQDKRKKVPFHTLPFKRPEILKLWLEAIRRENWTPSKTSRLCGQHFLPSDYVEKSGLTAKLLKPNAVPSVFLYPKQVPPKFAGSRRKIQKQVLTMKCRTCLRILDEHCKFPLEMEVVLGKTVGEIIQFFIPEMVKSDLVDDFICSVCMDSVTTFLNFIENCNSVESYLKEYFNQKQEQQIDDSSVPGIGNEDCDIDHITETSQIMSEENSTHYGILDQKLEKQPERLLEVNSNQVQEEEKKVPFNEKRRKTRQAAIKNNSLKLPKNEALEVSDSDTKPIFEINLTPKIEIFIDKTTEVHKTLSKARRKEETFGEKLQRLREKELVTAAMYNNVIKDLPPKQTLEEKVQIFLDEPSKGPISSKILPKCNSCPIADENSNSSFEVSNTPPYSPLDDPPKFSEEIIQENITDTTDVKSSKSPISFEILPPPYSNPLLKADEGSNDATELSNNPQYNPSNTVLENNDIIKTINLEVYPYPVIGNVNRGMSVSVADEMEATEFLEAFSKHHINLMKLHSLQETGSKRILFLGNAVRYCPDCKKCFSSERVLESHVKEAHPSNTSAIETVRVRPPRECPVCLKRFNRWLMLEDHVVTEHYHSYLYKCDKCGMQFRRKQTYCQHLKKYQLYQDCAIKSCPVCKKMIRKKLYEEHCKTHECIQCDICKRDFMTKSRFKVHLLKDHNIRTAESQPDPEKAALCPICGKLVRNKSQLRSHMVSHSETRPHLCDKCSKCFKTTAALGSHIKKVHESQTFECSICNAKIKSRDALRYHIRLKHIDVYARVCEVCGKGFSRNDYYKRHIKQHSPFYQRRIPKKRYRYIKTESGESILPCKYCNKKFRSVESLRLHLLNKHMKNPARTKCRYCNMTFANGGNRIRHERRHQDPEAFELTCNVCYTRFGNKEELTIHHARHQGSKHQCEMCWETFPSKYFLKHHKAEKHFDKNTVKDERRKLLKDGFSDLIIE